MEDNKYSYLPVLVWFYSETENAQQLLMEVIWFNMYYGKNPSLFAELKGSLPC
jgi:hypothetical protein